MGSAASSASKARIRHDSEVSKTHVPASRNNARVNPNGNVSFNQPISTKKNSPPNITIIKTDSNAGQLKVHQPLPLRHTLSDNKYPSKRQTKRNLSPTPSMKSCRSETCPEMLESYSPPVPERGPSQFETDDFRLTMCNDYEALKKLKRIKNANLRIRNEISSNSNFEVFNSHQKRKSLDIGNSLYQNRGLPQTASLQSLPGNGSNFLTVPQIPMRRTSSSSKLEQAARNLQQYRRMSNATYGTDMGYGLQLRKDPSHHSSQLIAVEVTQRSKNGNQRPTSRPSSALIRNY